MKKILIVAPSWIGDLVMAQTLLKTLKSEHPESIIDVLAPAACASVLKFMPEVNEVFISPFKHGQFSLPARYKLGKSLRCNNYSAAIVLPNSWKSALVPYFAKIPRRTGWVGEQRYHLLNDIRKLDKKKYPLMIERFMALGVDRNATLTKPYPRPEFIAQQKNVATALAALNIEYTPADKILALCPGAEFGPAKRWPAEYFAELANIAIDSGWRVWLFGGPKETAIADLILSKAQACDNLIAKTNLSQAICLLSLANTVVSNDSGLMHISSALDKDLVAIYGSTSTKFTPPQARVVNILQLNLECQPCMKRVCPLGHHNCMRNIYPQQVWDSVLKL